MKRRQHVGKKRAKVRLRRKDRRDAGTQLARIAKIADRMGLKLVVASLQPEFGPGAQFERAALVTDKNGKLWWVDPTAQRLAPAQVKH